MGMTITETFLVHIFTKLIFGGGGGVLAHNPTTMYQLLKTCVHIKILNTYVFGFF